MRILVTTDAAGGVWAYTEELVDALTARGHEMMLVTLGPEPGAAQREWLRARPGLDVVRLPAPLEWYPEPEPGLAESVGVLRKIVRARRPDVVHLSQFYYGAFELGAPKLVVAHSDVLGWWRAVRRRDPPDDAWHRRYREWVRAGLAGAQAVAAPSGWMAEQMRARYGVRDVRVIHNARSAARFRFRRRARRERMVVCAGRLWDEAKGVQDLVGAAALLGGDIQTVVAGPEASPSGHERFPVRAPGIRWAGVLGPMDLRRLLARAAVYAATSRYEPFGLAPLEAALAGCALVAADIPTYRELWGGCAEFYPPGDAPALAAAIRSLMDDDARRSALADAARARAAERFTPERMAREYEAVYHELAGAPAGAPRVPAQPGS
jgi:glycosyltransferase involved in cell wall biosynthesis